MWYYARRRCPAGRCGRCRCHWAEFLCASPRFIDEATAQTIVDAVGKQVTVVGVFVNATAAEMVELADRLPLDVIQLHGDEPPNMLTRLKHHPVLRAFRLKDDGAAEIADYINTCFRQDTPLECHFGRFLSP